MVAVTLRPLLHRGTENIALYGPNDAALNLVIGKLPGVRWSQTHRCSYLRFSGAHHQAVLRAMQGVADVDNSLLRNYLEKRGVIEKPMGSSRMAKAEVQGQS